MLTLIVILLILFSFRRPMFGGFWPFGGWWYRRPPMHGPGMGGPRGGGPHRY